MMSMPPNPFHLTPTSTQNLGGPQMGMSQQGGFNIRPQRPQMPPPGMVYSQAGGPRPPTYLGPPAQAGGMGNRPPLVNGGRPTSTFYGSGQTGGLIGPRPMVAPPSHIGAPMIAQSGFGSRSPRPF